MDKSSCEPGHVGQAPQGGQAGPGQNDTPATSPAAPEDYDSDPQGGGGRLDQVNADDAPAAGGDAPSHGSR